MDSTSSLLDRSLNMANLRLAWEEIAENNGIPGVDNVSIRVWRRNWEENLINLADEVRKNTYKPLPLRIRKIPKQNRREYRTLKIPAISDRILQRAVLQIIQPIYEQIFLDNSFGYRPNRGLRNAIVRITVLRENGYRWLLDANIDDFFNQVNQSLLIKFLVDDLPDGTLIPLISKWLIYQSSKSNDDSGIPMGSPISPLLANVYLHRLDQFCRENGFHCIRYADDFIIQTKTKNMAEKSKIRVQQCLSDLQLKYEPAKTSISSFEEGFTFLGVYFFNDAYQYTWEDKQITIEDSDADWLFNQYGLEYG